MALSHNGGCVHLTVGSLFAGIFPASRTLSLADVPAPPTTATSGPSSPDSFASLDPDGSWRKTCQGYSQVTLDGSLETVLGDLAACGYDAEWDCLPASAFGAPHRRDRVWLVAYPAGVGHERGSTSGVCRGGQGRNAIW